MIQLIIKDARGKAIMSLPAIHSYATLAIQLREMQATMPCSVWKHDTITDQTNADRYDSLRTSALSKAIVATRP